MEKEFQIHKKFEIQKERPLKKKFEIQETQEWFRQENSNDCGPCLILNSLALLGVQADDNSIAQVRQRINEIRSQDRTVTPLSSEGWFTTIDIQKYFSRAGLSVQAYGSSPDNKTVVEQSLRNIFETRSFDLIYITSGRHFRGILQKDNQLYLLDSFLNGPARLSQEEAWGLIENTISISTQERNEVIGIVRRQ